jgi:hypothetical protein
MVAPWSAQGQFTATLLPPTRAGNSVTARRPLWARIDGRAARELAGALHPATCPPIWARRAPCAAGAGPMVRALGEPEPAPRTAAPPSSPGTTRPALRDPPRVGPQKVTRPRRPHP